MNAKSKILSKLVKSRVLREAYIRSKVSVLLPSQIRSLRLRRGWTQGQLAEKADMKQARISTLEKIGESSFSIETLIRLAASFGAGLAVQFVPMSEMLDWENSFEPDSFNVPSIENDEAFCSPEGVRIATSTVDAPYRPFYPAIPAASGALFEVRECASNLTPISHASIDQFSVVEG
jgi:transcriptional regulator with XRE-family HTH domain